AGGRAGGRGGPRRESVARRVDGERRDEHSNDAGARRRHHHERPTRSGQAHAAGRRVTRRLRVVVAVALLVASATLATVMAAGPATLVAAHRGGAALWPEHSLLDFRSALAVGVRARGLRSRTTIQAFQVETIRRLRELEPKARTMLLVARGDVERDRARPAEAVRRARELGATDLGMNHRLIDTDVMSAARAAGIRVAAWTPNEEADIRRMVELGVDMVMSDRPDLAKRLMGR